MLSVAIKPIMLSVVMLNVLVLNINPKAYLGKALNPMAKKNVKICLITSTFTLT
jgi:hypothetical protein